MKTVFVISTLFITAITLFSLIFFNNKQELQCVDEKANILIVCTTMLIADAVKQLVDENFSVISLMGPGVDPHTYKVKPSDVHLLLHADGILYNGLHLEGKMGEVFESLKDTKNIICVTDGILKEDLISADYENIYDPHVWHDHVLWQRIIEYIVTEFSRIFPQYHILFEKNKKTYHAKLEKLANYIEKQLARLSVSQRILITAHDAFHYFGRRYNFVVKALQGLSTESDIGIKDVQNLVDIIVENNVNAVFLESCIPPRNIMALQESVLKQGKKIIIGGELFSDSLSNEQGPAYDYISMMKYNVKTIIDALKTVPT